MRLRCRSSFKHGTPRVSWRRLIRNVLPCPSCQPTTCSVHSFILELNLHFSNDLSPTPYDKKEKLIFNARGCISFWKALSPGLCCEEQAVPRRRTAPLHRAVWPQALSCRRVAAGTFCSFAGRIFRPRVGPMYIRLFFSNTWSSSFCPHGACRCNRHFWNSVS